MRLGVEQLRGRPFDVPLPAGVAQHVTLLGVTGAGKTTTAERLASGALGAGMAVVIVDAKGGGLRQVAGRLAESAGAVHRELLPGDPESLRYNPCAVGTRGQVADKLVSAFPFSADADIYRQIAHEALALLVGVLQALGEPVTIRTLRDHLGPRLTGLADRARDAAPQLADELLDLARRGGPTASAFAGMKARLGALLHGEFGSLFEEDGRPGLDLHEALGAGVTYMSLPAMANPGDVALMARVLLLDLKQAAYRRLQERDPAAALLVLDEFAALEEPEQITDLLRQAREARVATVVSSQHLPEAPALRHALFGAGLVIAHRLGPDDAQAIADLFGTERGVEVTHAIDFQTGRTDKGSARRVERYVVHPNDLKRLAVGEAAVLVAAGERRSTVVRVYPPVAEAVS